jgi:hypothetical protein
VKATGGEPLFRDDADAAVSPAGVQHGGNFFSVVVPVHATQPAQVPRIVASLLAVAASALHYREQVSPPLEHTPHAEGGCSKLGRCHQSC